MTQPNGAHPATTYDPRRLAGYVVTQTFRDGATLHWSGPAVGDGSSWCALHRDPTDFTLNAHVFPDRESAAAAVLRSDMPLDSNTTKIVPLHEAIHADRRARYTRAEQGSSTSAIVAGVVDGTLGRPLRPLSGPVAVAYARGYVEGAATPYPVPAKATA